MYKSRLLLLIITLVGICLFFLAGSGGIFLNIQQSQSLFPDNRIKIIQPSSTTSITLDDGTSTTAASDQLLLTFSENATRDDYEKVNSFLKKRGA